MSRRLADIILAVITILTVFCAFFYHQYAPITVSLYQSSSMDYVRAQVIEVVEEEAQEDPHVQGRYYGVQTLRAKLLEGERKGEEVLIDNYLASTHHIRLAKGDSFIACVDDPELASPLITVYNYDRAPYLYLFLGLLMVLIILVGHTKGIRTILSLIYCLFVIVTLLLPLIFNGVSPILLTMGLAALMIGYTLLMLNGTSLKTWTAIIATTAGVLLSGLIFYVMSHLIHLSGYQTDQAEALILISYQTGLKIQEILFAGVLISCLGAVMDVGLSLASALYEVKLADPTSDARTLFKAGMQIGKDMIGTMCNTLILAFTGSSMTILIAFQAYQIQYQQLMNSDFMAIEIAQGLAGTCGIVLTVPLGALVGAVLYTTDWSRKKVSRS